MSDENGKYQWLYKLYCSAYSWLPKKEIQVECNDFYKRIKKSPNFEVLFHDKAAELQAAASNSEKLKSQFLVLNTVDPSADEGATSDHQNISRPKEKDALIEPSNLAFAPKQNLVQRELDYVSAQIADLEFGTISSNERERLKVLSKEQEQLRRKLQKLKCSHQRQRRYRMRQKLKKLDGNSSLQSNTNAEEDYMFESD